MNTSGSLRLVQPLPDGVGGAIATGKQLMLETLEGQTFELNTEQGELKELIQAA